jgi:glycosyltransferase involved in cell wall biosynthesis
MPIVYLNGKYTAQRLTGVQRVADCLVRALDRQAPDPAWRWVLLCPPQGRLPALRNIEVRVVGIAGRLHLWEQLTLPWAARDGRLLSLAGSAPFFARRPAAMLHDAAVFDHPQAYTPVFVAWYRRLFRRLARRARPLLTVSAFSRERLALHLGVPAERFTVLPNGADHLDAVEPDEAVLDRHGLRSGRFLLAVASANPTKNLPALLAAFGRLAPEPGLRLLIVGGRNEQVFSESEAAFDPPGVVRTGPLADAPLKALYRHAVALIFPSTYEGFGLPPLEAMAHGCPVAASRAASLPEVCGDAALYFDPASVADIAAALRRLLDDEALRQRLRAAGLARAATFRWQASAARLRQALQDACQDAG